MSAFWTGFEKRARLDLGDIEDHLGVYLRDKKDRDMAEAGIGQETLNSVAIRHPWLTGIPTLGLWPAIAHSQAGKRIADRIMRESSTVRSDANAVRELNHAREVELMPKHIEDRKRQSYETMLGTAALAALAAQDSHYNSKKDDKKPAQG